MKKSLPLFLLALLAASTCLPAAEEWRPVRGGILYGISDLALVEHSPERSVFLCVHDNKRRGEPRVALVTLSPHEPVQYTPVEWAWDDDLIDLESLSRVPDEPLTYIAMTSRGKVYIVRLQRPENRIEILSQFSAPAVRDSHNFEGICLWKFGAKTLIVWAHRGEAADPGRIFYGELNREKKQITSVREVELRVPWPAQHTRHIADMKLDDSGALLIVSTADPGDDGPFESALYLAGTFYEKDGRAEFRKSKQMIRVKMIRDHKVEALELVPGLGGVVLGSDDENLGGWILSNW